MAAASADGALCYLLRMFAQETTDLDNLVIRDPY
jgi:hypothetical protein